MAGRNLRRVGVLAKIARAKKLTPGQLALAWCLSRKTLATANIGATSAAQLEENAAASDVVLDPKTLQSLEALFPIT
jgi:aryl-alcohol dehydrogenase-like predicted oxidoreductase